jgi:hypothetical protein
MRTMRFSQLVLCDRREGQSSQERYEQLLAGTEEAKRPGS